MQIEAIPLKKERVSVVGIVNKTSHAFSTNSRILMAEQRSTSAFSVLQCLNVNG